MARHNSKEELPVRLRLSMESSDTFDRSFLPLYYLAGGRNGHLLGWIHVSLVDT